MRAALAPHDRGAGLSRLRNAGLKVPRYRVLKSASVVWLAVVVSACGLSPDTRRDAEIVPQRIAAKNAEITQKETGYRTFVASPEYADYRVYAEREMWGNAFASARAKITAAQAAFDQNVKPLLARDRQADDQTVQAQVVATYTLIGEADRLAAVPTRRRGYIADLRAHYRDRFKDAAVNIEKVKALAADTSRMSRAAKTDFPTRGADVDTRVAALSALETAAHAAFAKVSAKPETPAQARSRTSWCSTTTFALSATTRASCRNRRKTSPPNCRGYREATRKRLPT